MISNYEIGFNSFELYQWNRIIIKVIMKCDENAQLFVNIFSSIIDDR